jgi:aspartate/methionine/tyrosine aminotransferase
VKDILTVHGHSQTCVNAFAQAGGLAALQGPTGSTDAMVDAWARRRRSVCAALAAVPGLSCPLPDGAFYAFVDARRTGLTSTEIADRLLEEHRVAVTPGAAFGQAGEGHFRVSFATSDEVLSRGVEQIARFFSKG